MNNYLVQLEKFGAGKFKHFHGSLSQHLMGTYDLLAKWQQPEPVCLAGLFHAVYGPQGLVSGVVSLDDRAIVEAVIGPTAEELVYLYCACDKEFFYSQLKKSDNFLYLNRFTGLQTGVTIEFVRNFCNIMLANELEILLASGGNYNTASSDVKRLIDLFSIHVENFEFNE